MKQSRVFIIVLTIIAWSFWVQRDAFMLAQQNTNGNIVVATCGTPPAVYPGANNRAPNTVDTNGNLCAGVSVSASIATAGLAVGVAAGISTSGVVGTPVFVQVTTSAPTYTAGQYAPPSMNMSGALRVEATVTPAANATVDINKIGGVALYPGPNGVLVTTTLATSGTIGILGANSGVDIGDVTINNSTGAAAVNIQDGGNSLTVDGTVAASNLPTTVDTNSGTKSASTLRVVLATDQPALTNKLLVTPDSVALPANQSVNVAQLAGTTTDTNSGTKSAGTLRVVLATDQPALTNKLLVTPDSVALPANQSVNVSQINGVTVTTGAGTSTSTIRVVKATPDPCDSGFAKTYTAISLTANTQIVTANASEFLHVCAINLVVAAATNVGVVSGTGSTCGTSTGGVFGGTTAATGFNLAANGGIAMGNGGGTIGRPDTAGENICILVSAANQVSGSIVTASAP